MDGDSGMGHSILLALRQPRTYLPNLPPLRRLPTPNIWYVLISLADPISDTLCIVPLGTHYISQFRAVIKPAASSHN